MPFYFKKTTLAVAVIFSFAANSFAKDDLSFNDKKFPKSTEDLLVIQDALQKNLQRSKDATVSISLGQGFGSGVIISEEGLILTAAHVTGGVDKELTVIMNDGTKYKAITMGLVSTTDAAMMKITDKKEGGFPFVDVNRDGDYKMGDWVYAMGHGGGFDKLRGPMVRLGRILIDEESTLQTDCKVIGGDSGGPLYDMRGRLIGIHSRVGMGGSEGSLEVNRHVPMREYLTNWEAMESNKFLGTGPFAKPPVKGTGFLGVKTAVHEKGLLVEKVGRETAAEKAEIKEGDILTKLGDEALKDKEQFTALIKEMAAGQKIKLTLLREGEEQVIEFNLGTR